MYIFLKRNNSRWIQTFKNANAIVNKGQILSSSLTGRAYVEAFMFDKYSKDSSRNVDIMAITFEGTFSVLISYIIFLYIYL